MEEKKITELADKALDEAAGGVIWDKSEAGYYYVVHDDGSISKYDTAIEAYHAAQDLECKKRGIKIDPKCIPQLPLF